MLNNILHNLQQGRLDMITSENIQIMNEMAKGYLSLKGHRLNESEIYEVELLLRISNILYNNSDIFLTPLDDGVYDLLLELYRDNTNKDFIGAEPIIFEETNGLNENSKPLINPFIEIDTKKIYDEYLFGQDIFPNRQLTSIDLLKYPFIQMDKYISKRNLNTKHSSPKLVGTLDKCKFVLNEDARMKGVFDDTNVKVLERDFFGNHLNMGLINYNDPFTIIGELKYDGVSVEATVTNRVLSARTRGDAINDVAADITPILEGYMFPYADPNIEEFDMKFEAIMTYQNLATYNQLRGKNYKNCRTAISSIFSSSEGYRYMHLITLVPLATSIEGIDRIAEIEFMNKYYFSGEQLRYVTITGNYTSVLFQIHKFVKECEYMREYMPFMFDGVVLSYYDEYRRNKLGRVGAINKYSIAVKFTPLKRVTTFREYKFTVGQDGKITPMIYYDPVEFFGTIHDHSSGHSYERFKELNLKVGDLILVEYVNDVMPYVYPMNTEENRNNIREPYPFITHCPSCGETLEISKSGKTIKCPNIGCPERNIKRVVGILGKLGLNDFAEASLDSLGFRSLYEMLNTNIEYVVSKLGVVNGSKFMQRMDYIKTAPIYDYAIIGALGFTGIAIETWKLILSNISLEEILQPVDNIEIENKLISIKGIGPGISRTIANERFFFMEDLVMISKMSNIIRTFGVDRSNSKTIRFTGVRDKELIDKLNQMGHSAGEGSVTNKTDILIIPYEGHESTKVNKAKNNGHTKIIPIDEFKNNIENYLL